ncbi:MAG: hypothetical protein R2728_00290 [Chitinophagales bacterium]
MVGIKFKEVWHYRDLIVIFVKRDFKKQPINKQFLVLYGLQPLMTTLVSMFLFGSIAKLSDDGVPQFLFFFGSMCLWSSLANIINTTQILFAGMLHYFQKYALPSFSYSYFFYHFCLFKNF